MTDALAHLIADLREKEAKATPGPWFPVIAFVEGGDYPSAALLSRHHPSEAGGQIQWLG